MSLSRTVRTAAFVALSVSACTIQRKTPAQFASADEHMSHMMPADLALPRSTTAGIESQSQGTPPVRDMPSG
jgi:hypothetical protein